MTTLTYRELTPNQQRVTYQNFVRICKQENYTAFGNFEEYHDEQIALDLDFDAETLECIG
jgi:hypothetical protein